MIKLRILFGCRSNNKTGLFFEGGGGLYVLGSGIGMLKFQIFLGFLSLAFFGVGGGGGGCENPAGE